MHPARASAPQQWAPADDELVSQIRTGDERAFDALFVRYHQRLVQFGTHFTGSEIIADEIVVDVFVHIWEIRNTWQVQSGHVPEYLYVAVRNRALNVTRTDKRREEIQHRFVHEPYVPGMAQGTFDILERLYAEDVTRALESAIAELPERSRVAITLRWQQQMPVANIAAVLGTTPGSVHMLLNRGLRALRELLKKFPL